MKLKPYWPLSLITFCIATFTIPVGHYLQLKNQWNEGLAFDFTIAIVVVIGVISASLFAYPFFKEE